MALSTLTGYIQMVWNYVAGNAGLSSGINLAAPGLGNTVSAKQSFTFGHATANAADETIMLIVTIAASGTATINLYSTTDVMGNATILVRIKSFFFWLLGTLDDSLNGTACSSVVIGAAVSAANTLELGGTGPTRTLQTNSGVGDKSIFISGNAAGITVSNSLKNVLITNEDGVNGAAVMFGGFGSIS